MSIAGRLPAGAAIAGLGLAFALAGTGLVGTAHASRRTDAIAAYDHGDYGSARTRFLSLARTGDADAAYRLGIMSDLGQGVPEDATEAFRWYRRAALTGYAPAEFNVAVMLDSHRGVPHDAAQAAEWYARAATHGNHRAQYNLGLLYSSGEGVPRNRPVAQAWFRLAESGGIPAAAEHIEAAGTRPETRGVASGRLHAVTPVAPKADTALSRREVEIVWTAPAQTVPVRFFLQVAHGGRDHGEIYADYVDSTAALVRLPAGGGAYAWRVYTVSPTTADYSIGAWIPFTVRPR